MVENLEYCFGRDSQGFSAILRTKVLKLTTRIPFLCEWTRRDATLKKGSQCYKS